MKIRWLCFNIFPQGNIYALSPVAVRFANCGGAGEGVFGILYLYDTVEENKINLKVFGHERKI